MDVKIVVALFVVGLIAKGHAELYCYVCEDCADGNNLSEKFLVSCSGEETTTASPISSTTLQSVEPPVETIAPTNPTTESPSSQTDSTTVQPTQPPETEPPTETTIVTESPPPTEEPTTQETTATTLSTVEQSPSISTAPTPENPITTTSAIPVTESSNVPTDITTATNPPVPPTTTGQPTAMPPPTSLQRQTPVKQTDYNCYVLVNATHHVNRGCVAASKYPNDMCRVANALVLPVECRVCDTDRCNSSSRIVLSVFLLVFSVGTILGL